MLDACTTQLYSTNGDGEKPIKCGLLARNLFLFLVCVANTRLLRTIEQRNLVPRVSHLTVPWSCIDRRSDAWLTLC